MIGRFLSLFPTEMQPGDEWDDRVFDHYEMMEEPQPELRLNCRMIFQDDLPDRPWHTDAPMRIYRRDNHP
jgi:hypothetical protein